MDRFSRFLVCALVIFFTGFSFFLEAAETTSTDQASSLPDLPPPDPSIPVRESVEKNPEGVSPELSLDDLPKLKKKPPTSNDSANEPSQKGWLMKAVEDQEKFQNKSDKAKEELEKNSKTTDDPNAPKDSEWLLKSVEEQKKLKEEEAEKNKEMAEKKAKATESVSSLKKDETTNTTLKQTQSSNPSSVDGVHKDGYSASSSLSPFSSYTTGGLNGMEGVKTDLSGLNSSTSSLTGSSELKQESSETTAGSMDSTSEISPKNEIKELGDLESSSTGYRKIGDSTSATGLENTYNLPSSSNQGDSLKSAPQSINMENLYSQNLGHSFSSQPKNPSSISTSQTSNSYSIPSSTTGKTKIADPNDFLNH